MAHGITLKNPESMRGPAGMRSREGAEHWNGGMCNSTIEKRRYKGEADRMGITRTD